MRFLLLGLLALAACATDVTPQTPAQRYYAAKHSYAVLLDTAVSYKQDCYAKPPALQTECRKVVDLVRAIDLDVQEVEVIASEAILNGETDMVILAVEELRRLKRQLEQRIAEDMLKENN